MSDRVVVLRNGRIVDAVEGSQASRDAIGELMLGNGARAA